jgi:superfamily II DNA helicase RecQ
MPLKFFHIPSRDPVPLEADLTSFLSRHRVVTIERRFVEDGQSSFWAICVDYLHGPETGGPDYGAPGRSARKVDYKEILTPEQFDIFARLRDLRKEIATREAVAVYNIFTNEQLAEIVKRHCATIAQMQEIEGIGEARAGKYGAAFLAALAPPSP